jgi:tetratricopeptide (TPR) repeat protein
VIRRSLVWRKRSFVARMGVAGVALGLVASQPRAEDPADTSPVVTPGAVLEAAPPDLGLPGPAPTLDQVRWALMTGDVDGALRLADRVAETTRSARDRDAALLLAGLLHREAGHPNAASAAFTQVRASAGSLAMLAAFYEAEADLQRGKPGVAVRECEEYRAAWPEGPHVTSCLRVEALGHAALGNETSAMAAAFAYDRDHEDAKLTEAVDLRLARFDADHNPTRAIPRLRRLAVYHEAALTGRVAEELLSALRAAGHEDAVVPSDVTSQKARLVSLRGAGRLDAAMGVWASLVSSASEDPQLAAWLETEAVEFGWRARAWDVLIPALEAQFVERPDGEVVHSLFKACSRAGRHAEAAHWALIGQRDYPRHARWWQVEDTVARELMLAGRYEEARTQFDVVARRGGWAGRNAEFYAAFAAHMGGDHEDAVSRLSELIDDQRGHTVEALYWRAKALDALGRADAAAADRVALLSAAPESWYAVLLIQDGQSPHDGGWHGGGLPALGPAPTVHVVSAPPVARPSSFVAARPSAAPGFASLRFTPHPVGLTAVAPIEPPPTLALRDGSVPPLSYVPGPFYDPVETRQLARALADEHGQTWPLLPAIVDLAESGLYDLSGPLFAAFYEDVEEARRSWTHPRRAQAALLPTDSETWRAMALYTRDHHHGAKFTNGLHTYVADPIASDDTRRLAWPIAHDRVLWQSARHADVDPFLVLGLMRQESVYDANALSRAGARGAMQIMPRTGHLIADKMVDLDYTVADLEDPLFAIDYGVTYLGMLMDRFDHVYPLALASYNGGPHNVSAWLSGSGRDLPMDAFVEHIPFRETRGYVQSVTANYATYADLYEARGVRVPDRALGDHADVVDF